MGYPDFSEFSFGYAVVREIESRFGGRLVLPTFPTQPQEAIGGYDVEFLDHGVPLFLQFKRSEVLTRKSCREWQQHPSRWTMPIYRMNLHRKAAYRQHFLMGALQRRGNIALYCTSAVPDKEALNRFYARSNSLDASAFFRPNEINLPDTHEYHHVSFNAGSPVAYLYSAEPVAFKRKLMRFEDVLAATRRYSRRSTVSSLRSLSRFTNEIQTLGSQAVAYRERLRFAKEREVSPQALYSFIEEESYDQQVGIQQTSIFERLNEIESVVRRAAIVAYYEMDSFLVSLSKKRLAS